MSKFTFFSILLLSITSNTFSQFAGGTGTKKDPFIIKTVLQLDSIRFFLNKHFALSADINFQGSGFDSLHSKNNEGWQPIGDNENPFTGSFDGNGKTIKHMYINRSGSTQVGLFGYCAKGYISNLSLENCFVTGNEEVGALTGACYGLLENCTISGQITGIVKVGGLTGYNKGQIIKCLTNCKVNGELSTGGLTGCNENEIENCQASGSVYGKEATGGLVGKNGFKKDHSYSTDDKPSINEWESFIENCFSSGTVSGLSHENQAGSADNRWTGGLVGSNENGVIFNCQSECIVKGVEDVGGLAGYNDEGWINNCSAKGKTEGSKNTGSLLGLNYGLVENSYSTGNVSGQKTAGGLIGHNSDGWINNCISASHVDNCIGRGGLVGFATVEFEMGRGSVNNCFWDIQKSGTDKSFGGKGLQSSELKNSAVLKKSGWDFDKLWNIDKQKNNGYPYLKTTNSERSAVKRKLTRVISQDRIKEIKVSSFYKNESSYSPQNTVDQNEKTAWVEGKEGYGIGESICYSFNEPVNIEELRIINGYAKSEELYLANSRVKKLKITVKTDSQEMIDSIDLNDLPYSKVIKDCGEKIFKVYYENKLVLKEISFTILDIYKGSKFKDTCISEFVFIERRMGI
jgi:hypothetical protein